jgi:ribonuclease III
MGQLMVMSQGKKDPSMELKEVEKRISYEFRDTRHLELALSHKSHANEGRPRSLSREDFVLLHNERLEFLGDAVLGLVISDLLSEKFPKANEGQLSRFRSSLVKEPTLARLARDLDLGPFLRLGKGEASTLGHQKDSILSSTYEALLGAIYLDGGFSAAHGAAKVHFQQLLLMVEDATDTIEPKTQLQELCQSRFRASPVYLVVLEDGPDHEKSFEVRVSVGGYERYGKGRNKKEAEQSAARFLLQFLLDEQSRKRDESPSL